MLLALALSATAVLAHTYWHGTGTGDFFASWNAILNDDAVPPGVSGTFVGEESHTGTFSGTLSLNAYGCYCGSGNWETNESPKHYGTWEGCFCPVQDTAQGTWEETGTQNDGTWAGHQDH